MARVHQKTAAKDYPAQGIKKGDTYFTWKTRQTFGKSYYGVVHRSLTRPVTTSQSPFQSAMDEFQASAFAGIEDADALRSADEDPRNRDWDQERTDLIGGAVEEAEGACPF
jgi:hypothetical protein